MEPSDPWYGLLSETQFAVHQTVLGLRELGRAVHAKPLWTGSPGEVRFMIHNGLFSYTTGVERLAKLVLSLAHFRESGAFPPVKSFGHRIGTMAASIAALDPLPTSPPVGPDYAETGNPLAGRPDFITLLDDYASGSGRYEYLDSLNTTTTGVDVYQRWNALVDQVEPSAAVTELCGIPRAIAEALYLVSRAVDENLGVSSFDHLFEPYTDNVLPISLHPESLEVALNYYEFARWVAAHLSNLSTQIFYHDGHSRPVCPYLPEVIDQYLLHGRDHFAEFHILQLNDLTATVEALADVYENIPEEPDGEEDDI